MAVATELMRVIRDMRHADELFQWLSDALVQHFSAQVAQFWVAQVDSQGQYFVNDLWSQTGGLGLHLDSTATRHTFAGVPLWLHGPTHQGWSTNTPS